ncbi:MAG: prenyltransferase/squalene oxidase repeat-containing protein [Planctomycetaceae bacterium]
MPTIDPQFPTIETEPQLPVPAQHSPAPAQVKSGTPQTSAATTEPTNAATSPADDETIELAPVITEQQMTVGGYGVSVLLHLSILVLMATIVLKTEEPPLPLDSLTLWEGEKEPLDAVVADEPELLDVNLNPAEEEKQIDEPLPDLKHDVVTSDTPVDELLQRDTAEPELDEIAMTPGIGLSDGSMFAGRGKATRSALVAAQGGNSESEAAVAIGLRWLVEHQQADGSWSFDHRGAKCDETCGEPGSLAGCTMGATSMALLTFLGAGHTHQNGEYSPQVRRGIDYLLEHMQEVDGTIDLRQRNRQGNMYVHGLATMALSEAYAMTKDPKLERPTQLAVNFIVKAQHQDGGWRYEPNQAGDTSVVGWQVLALESARTAGISVPRTTFGKTTNFLDSVQGGGSTYGYMSPGDGQTTTAVGLLCRMYFGWDRDRKEIREGAAYLSKMGPSTDNIYYNYYATQVMHHYGGDEWNRWNAKMRDHLVDTQIRRGHGRGSWDPRDPHAGSGGRLYMTALATMTLEVYYRHLPLYQWRDLPE